MTNLLASFDPNHFKPVINTPTVNKAPTVDKGDASNYISGNKPIPQNIRRLLEETSFETLQTQINEYFLPILKEEEFEKIKESIKLCLKEDTTIGDKTYIGFENDLFIKEEILNTDILSFLELLSATLYYTVTHLEKAKKNMIPQMIEDNERRSNEDSARNQINEGKFAYEVAAEKAVEKALAKVRESGILKGDKGADGKSAYDLAVENGFEGSVQDWLASFTSTTSPSNNVQINIGASEIADIEFTNSPTTITEEKLRLGLKIGYNLAGLRWIYNAKEDTRRNARIDLILESISDKCQLICDSYEEFQQSIITYYKDDVEYYAAISIGIYLERLEKLQEFSTNDDTDKEIQKYLKILVENNIKGIKNDISSSIISNKQKFLSFIDSIKMLPIPTQFEYICLFFNCDDDVKKDDDSCYIRQIIDLLYTENKNLEEAKSYVMFFLKENQLTANRKAAKTLQSLLNILESISQEEYDLRMKYDVWPESSTWGSQEAFENICIGIIEEIIKKTNNRSEAISLSETSLKMCKIFGKEKDIQVYNKVIYEFYLASEEEVTILRNQILQTE